MPQKPKEQQQQQKFSLDENSANQGLRGRILNLLNVDEERSQVIPNIKI